MISPLVTRWVPLVIYLTVFAALAVWTVLRSEEQPVATVVAAHDMLAGTLLGATDVKSVQALELIFAGPSAGES
jgi:hypothetical protein